MGTSPSQFHSGVFKLFDGTDVSKKIRFILSQISADNEIVLTIPNQSGVLSLEGHTHTISSELIELIDTPNEYSSGDGYKVLQVKSDLTGMEFTDSPILSDIYYTGDIIELKIASCDISVQRNQLGSYSSQTWLPAGDHNVKITTDYFLNQSPTLDTTKGSLTFFNGSGTDWTAVLTLTSCGD